MAAIEASDYKVLGWVDGDLGHGRAFRFEDPFGHVFEIYWDSVRYVPAPEERPALKNLAQRFHGRGCCPRRLDHLNLLAEDVTEFRAFMETCLGSRVTELIELDDGRTAPRLEGLGSRPWPITTSDPMAQKYFDQGLMLAYGFNHAEEAARRDPDCAMCWWGAALVVGPNVNDAMHAENAPPACRLLSTASRHCPSVSSRMSESLTASRLRSIAACERPTGTPRGMRTVRVFIESSELGNEVRGFPANARSGEPGSRCKPAPWELASSWAGAGYLRAADSGWNVRGFSNAKPNGSGGWRRSAARATPSA